MRDAIRERTDETMFTPEEKLGHIRMATVRHDRSSAINSGTSTQYPGRVFACSTEEKGPGPGACESDPSGVMGKKHDGSWRMCVDFTDLNKACPQDCYLLSEIDWKVESLCGYPFKCFLDAYKGYHQIQMAKSNEDKTAFHTSQGAHPIAVVTDQPIKQITSHPDVAGRLQKWSVMLGEHNITYRPRTSVKGQILADFLIEKPDESPSDTSVDGQSPEGTEFTYALRFQFTASNNEAEYEALIAGLRIAAQMGVRNVNRSVLQAAYDIFI
ncbi:reverse transcriptase domain-containing protein [Tanacetum coccineum]